MFLEASLFISHCSVINLYFSRYISFLCLNFSYTGTHMWFHATNIHVNRWDGGVVERTRAQILKKNIPGLMHGFALYYLSGVLGNMYKPKRIIPRHLLIYLKGERCCV